jgi:hypothetical protein
VNALRRNDCSAVWRVTYIPRAMVAVASRTFRNQVRMGKGGVNRGVVVNRGKGILSGRPGHSHPLKRDHPAETISTEWHGWFHNYSPTYSSDAMKSPGFESTCFWTKNCASFSR